MLKQVALIDNEDWDQGAVHVNGLIAGIVKQYETRSPTEPVLQERSSAANVRLETQVRFLIQTATANDVTAEGIASQIDAAITIYMKDNNANALPDELEVFRDLSAAFRGFAYATPSSIDDTEKVEFYKRQIEILEARVFELQELLVKAGADKTSEAATYTDKFMDATVKSAGTAAGPMLLGGVVYFAGNFIDPGTVNSLASEISRYVKLWKP